jgi:hypothetical protein
MQDARCKIQDARYKIQDARCKMQDLRCKMQGDRLGFEVLDFKFEYKLIRYPIISGTLKIISTIRRMTFEFKVAIKRSGCG